MISDKHLQWLEARGINAETAVRFGCSTDSGAIKFPFLEDGVEVSAKYRGPQKKFWQTAGGKRTFWNADALNDPGLHDGSLSLIITEGEIDALTAIECGFPLTVSVPDGAPPEGSVSNDPVDDETGKFAFMFNNRDRLKKIKHFILAVDSDGPGIRLAGELVRRLGASKCSFVTYPEDCKDINEVLLKHGQDAVAEVINSAKPYPVKGVYKLEDYPPGEPNRPVSTGWPTVDQHFMLFPGAFTIVTGIPSHGKTTWTMNMSCNLFRLHRWRTAVFSPEMPTVPHLHNKLRRISSGFSLERVLRDPKLLRETDQFLNDAFVFIDHDPEEGDSDEDMTLEWVIEKAEDAVHRHGIKHLIIDPWNEVEHARPPHETEPQYIGRGIRALKRFAKKRQVAVTVIAHPTKAVGGENPRMPNLYDIEGSAHWYNKPDLGVIVGRDPEIPDQNLIRIAKVRFDETGQKGDVHMRYDAASCRFEMLDPSYQPIAEKA